MKTIATLITLMHLVTLAGAQSGRATLKAAFEYGRTPYEITDGLGGVIVVDYPITRRLALSGSLGHVSGFTEANGRSQGTANGEVWDNSYSYRNTEQFSHLDAALVLGLSAPDARNQFRFGAGGSLTHTNFYYAPDRRISRGVILSANYVNHRKTVPMMQFFLEDEWRLTQRIALFGRLSYRTAFSDQHYLERQIIYDGGGTLTSKSAIRNNLTLALGLGYRL